MFGSSTSYLKDSLLTRSDVTYAAAQILLSRVRERPINSCTYSMELVSELVQAAMDCRGVLINI